MNKILELRSKRAALWEQTKNFLEEQRDENGLVPAPALEQYDRMTADVQALGAEIKRLEDQMAMDAQLSAPTSAPVQMKPAESRKSGNPFATQEYNDAFWNAMRGNFTNDVATGLSVGTDEKGGYTVPDEFERKLVQALEENNIFRNLAHIIRTQSGTRTIPVAAEYGSASWIEEGGALSFGDATFSQILLDAHKLHVAIKVTEELLYDAAFNLEGYIIDQFGKALANAEEDAFLNGTGRGQPLGLFAETGGGTPALSAASISADHIMQLIYALKRPYRKSARFIMHDKVIAAIRQLKDNNGVYLWQPALTSGEPDKLLGYDVYTSPFCPEGKIAFGDFSYYNIGDRGTRSFSELRELFAGNGMIGYVAKERVDGKLILPEAVQILTITGGKPLKP